LCLLLADIGISSLLGAEINAGMADGGLLGVQRMQHLTSPQHQHPVVASAMRSLLAVLWHCTLSAALDSKGCPPISAAEIEQILTAIISQLEAAEAEQGRKLMLELDNLLFPATFKEACEAKDAALKTLSPKCDLYNCSRPPVVGDDDGIALEAFSTSTSRTFIKSTTISSITTGSSCNSGDTFAPATPSAVSASIASASTVTATSTASCASTIIYQAVAA
jgi:hypothetical protein